MTVRINPTTDRARGNARKATIIESGQTVSDDVDMSGFTLAGVLISTALTGTSLTFRGTIDKTNYFDIKNAAGTTIAITLSGTGIYKLNPSDFVGIDNIRAVSNGAEAAQRSITLLGADILNG